MFKSSIPPWGWSFTPDWRGGLICRITFLGDQRTIHVSTALGSQSVEEVRLSDDQSGKLYRVRKGTYSLEATVSTFDPNEQVWSPQYFTSDPLPMSTSDHEQMAELMEEEAARSPTPFPDEVQPIWEQAVAFCRLIHYRPRR